MFKLKNPDKRGSGEKRGTHRCSFMRCRRLIYLVPVAFGVSLLVFALVHLAPGDPISAIVPPDAPKEVVDKLKEYYGFDKPLPVQYGRWLAASP